MRVFLFGWCPGGANGAFKESLVALLVETKSCRCKAPVRSRWKGPCGLPKISGRSVNGGTPIKICSIWPGLAFHTPGRLQESIADCPEVGRAGVEWFLSPPRFSPIKCVVRRSVARAMWCLR